MQRMKFWTAAGLLLLTVVFFSRCEQDTDSIYPEIDMDFEDAFPKNCDSLKRGESFRFKAKFIDNQALGAYSIDIHNNFDHHTHSTDVVECEQEPDKEPVNPFLFIDEFEIPEGASEFETDLEIAVPEDADTGDYHFMVRLSDAHGWQTLKGISIKITD